MSNLNHQYTFITKSDLINMLVEFSNEDQRLYNIEYFDDVVEMTIFHEYIHGLLLNRIQILVSKLYKYYNMKMYRIKEYSKEFVQKDFEMFFIYNNEYDMNKAKLFIFTITSIFPELNVIEICRELLYNNNYDNYTETITKNEFEVHINNIMEVMDDNERNVFIYKFLRFYKASLPLSSREYIQLNKLNIVDKKSIECMKVLLRLS